MTQACHMEYLDNNPLRPEQSEGYATPQTWSKTKYLTLTTLPDDSSLLTILLCRSKAEAMPPHKPDLKQYLTIRQPFTMQKKCIKKYFSYTNGIWSLIQNTRSSVGGGSSVIIWPIMSIQEAFLSRRQQICLRLVCPQRMPRIVKDLYLLTIRRVPLL